jgi:two-component system LytT family sensor kinase
MESQDTTLFWLDNRVQLIKQKRKVDLFRVLLHVGYWGSAISITQNQIERVMRMSPSKPADHHLFMIVWANHYIVTLLTFYSLGYFAVPTILDQLITYRITKKANHRKVLQVVVAIILCFIVYNTNVYFLFNYVANYFKDVPPYIARWIDPLRNKGPFGLFVDLSLFTFIWGYHASYMLTPLLLKVVREAVIWGADGVMKEAKARQMIGNQLSFLRQQINPHFLFNMFNNIHGLIETTNAAAAGLLAKLSYLLRYALKGTKSEFVLLTNEIQFIEDYVEMEMTRHFDPRVIQYQVKGETDGYLIPPLLLVTFIENAFKHGLNTSIEDGWVKLELDVNDQKDCLTFDISNNRSSTKLSNYESTGIGLVNARKRLELLFALGTYQLQITDTPESYHVHLEIPLKRIPENEYESVY